MNQKERISLQRQKVREAIGILRGVEELFGAETEGAGDLDANGFEAFQAKVTEFERWIFDESKIA